MSRVVLNRKSLPVHAWPQADQAAWVAARRTPDLLDPAVGRAAQWKEATQRFVERGYGTWLAWLQSIGALDPLASPAARATRERLGQYIEAMQARGLANRSLGNAVQALANALQTMAPDGDWAFIQKASTRLHARAIAVVDINAKMRPREEVYQLGVDMMAAADNDRFRSAWDRAVLYRDGLLLALLILRPLRISNAAQIRIGRHLHRRGEAWWLSFDAAEMKAARPFECPWPEVLSAALDRYLDVHRPRITDGGRTPRKRSDALWLSRNGTPMKVGPLADRVTIRTNEEWGSPINPHTFRHIVATEIATNDPSNATDIMAVLGHSRMSVSEKHYNRARMLEAGDQHQAAVARRRKGLRQEPRRDDTV